jgi:hypothetical protein
VFASDRASLVVRIVLGFVGLQLGVVVWVVDRSIVLAEFDDADNEFQWKWKLCASSRSHFVANSCPRSRSSGGRRRLCEDSQEAGSR